MHSCYLKSLVLVTAGAAASREKEVVIKSSEKARKASHSQSSINIMIISIIGPTHSAYVTICQFSAALQLFQLVGPVSIFNSINLD